MKKIIPLVAVAILATGCGNKTKVNLINETDTPVNTSQTNQLEVTPTINNQSTNTTSMDNSRTLSGQTDLAQEYSQAILNTNLGNIKVKFYSEESPKTVNNFLNLAQQGFYNGTKFHRIIKDFMIQGGDPNSKSDNWATHGTGGPDYRFEDEFNSHQLVRGSLAMANAGANTNGSQFFIVTATSTPWLDGKHTNFGEIVEGMEIVSQIEAAEVNENDHPLKDITINSVELVK